MKHYIRVALLLAAVSAAAQTTPKNEELTSLSVDDLLNVEVTSVARRGQKLSETTAATFVLTQEDIRRTGATSIPELLRMVPGFNVAQINANIWAVSARGFNGRAADKILILIDGRSAHSQVFFGVDWNTIDFFLEDVERIEVTRGPGGTLWGANAMNGVINIVTKHAVDTQGILAVASHGTSDGPSGALRYGGRFGATGYYRAFFKTFDRPTTKDALHQSFNDAWSMSRGGFRAEWATRFGAMNFETDTYSGSASETTTLPNADFPLGGAREVRASRSGHDMMFRWKATQSRSSETTLQASYDFNRTESQIVDERRYDIDLDFQHHLLAGTRHDITWGLEGRRAGITSGSDSIIHLGRKHDADTLVTGFIQDEITIAPKLRITAGTKIVHDPLSGTQWQPTIRGLWLPLPNQAVWAAVTRAVRLPSQLQRFSESTIGAATLPDGETIHVVLLGNRELKPETQTSFEIGYRIHPARAVAVDVTAYVNSINGIIAEEQQAQPRPGDDGQLIIPLKFENDPHGHTAGMEAFVTIRPRPGWDLSAGYALWLYRMSDDDDDFGNLVSPKHQFQLRSFLTLTSRLELDSTIYFAGAMPERHVKRYVRTDMRLGWQASPHLELSVIGRNLTDNHHIEIDGIIEQPTLAPVMRSVAATATWRF